MTLRIIVCIKAVPGFIMNPEISEAGDGVDYTAGSIILNESDEYALQEAVALKKEFGGEVTAVTVGTLSAQKALQVGLAKGADKAVRIDANPFDPAVTARLLAGAIQSLQYDLILTGVESSDYMGARVGLTTAELLGLHAAFAVTEVASGEEPDTLRVIKELGRGRKQILEMALPVLLCMQTGTAPLTFVPFRKMAQAQSKQMQTMRTRDLGLEQDPVASSSSRILDLLSPQERARAEIITGSPAETVSVFHARMKEVL